jgi:O-acetyl-ADP-ribose deacetylase (regulator of RNase III)
VPLSARLVDITTLHVDAIVNAANEALRPGGGVCGAIHGAAGPLLAEACELVAPCPTGEARLTPGFRLPARFVIHAVAPRWLGGTHGEAEALTRAYAAVFTLAAEHGLRSVALPAIGTGIYRYPLHDATRIAVAQAREALDSGTSVDEVIFACIDPKTLAAYRDAGVPGDALDD